MAEPGFEFRSVSSLTSGAIGQPGQRTFYLLVGQGDRWLRLWLEKEQLLSLSLGIKQLLALLPEWKGPESETSVEPPAQPPLLAEFRVGRMALGYDENREMAVIYAYAEEAEEDSEPVFACWASRRQISALGSQSDEVVAAGRPLCRLCGQPMDPEGHICPRHNGHHHVDVSGELQP